MRMVLFLSRYRIFVRTGDEIAIEFHNFFIILPKAFRPRWDFVVVVTRINLTICTADANCRVGGVNTPVGSRDPVYNFLC